MSRTKHQRNRFVDSVVFIFILSGFDRFLFYQGAPKSHLDRELLLPVRGHTAKERSHVVGGMWVWRLHIVGAMEKLLLHISWVMFFVLCLSFNVCFIVV